MASHTVCTSCLRAMRLQARRELQPAAFKTSHRAIRPFVSRETPTSTRSLSTSQRRLLDVDPTPKRATQPPPPPRSNKPTTPAPDAITAFAAKVRSQETFKSTTEPYIAYGSTESLFQECSAQCNYTIPSVLKQPPEPPPKNAALEDVGEADEGSKNSIWYRSKKDGGLGLDITFNTWAQVCFLHMYMLTVRLRCFPPEHARVWHQNLLDHFFYAAEDRMAIWHGMSARGTRNKNLKDIWQQWRGVILSYDEGLVKGDAVLAAAVWRNVFKADVEVDLQDVALVTAYIRRMMQMLDTLEDGQVAAGEVRFERNAQSELKAALGRQSPLMQKPFSQEEVQAVGVKEMQGSA